MSYLVDIGNMVSDTGRMIPAKDLGLAACESKAEYGLIRPSINYATIAGSRKKLVKSFPKLTFLSAKKVWTRVKELMRQLSQDNIFSNLLKGIWLPVCYPKYIPGDYGDDMEWLFLQGAITSLKRQFPEREERVFKNCLFQPLRENVKIIDPSHACLLTEMAKGPVVGLMFFPFQGFSDDDIGKIMSILPDYFHSSGPIDFLTAMAGWPDVLGRDDMTPGYGCPATSWKSPDKSLFFRIEEEGALYLNYSGDNSQKSGSFTSGLIFTGE